MWKTAECARLGFLTLLACSKQDAKKSVMHIKPSKCQDMLAHPILCIATVRFLSSNQGKVRQA
jgi:hypothetical protein